LCRVLGAAYVLVDRPDAFLSGLPPSFLEAVHFLPADNQGIDRLRLLLRADAPGAELSLPVVLGYGVLGRTAQSLLDLLDGAAVDCLLWLAGCSTDLGDEPMGAAALSMSAVRLWGSRVAQRLAGLTQKGGLVELRCRDQALSGRLVVGATTLRRVPRLLASPPSCATIVSAGAAVSAHVLAQAAANDAVVQRLTRLVPWLRQRGIAWTTRTLKPGVTARQTSVLPPPVVFFHTLRAWGRDV
jgi:hypothetical protein